MKKDLWKDIKITNVCKTLNVSKKDFLATLGYCAKVTLDKDATLGTLYNKGRLECVVKLEFMFEVKDTRELIKRYKVCGDIDIHDAIRDELKRMYHVY